MKNPADSAAVGAASATPQLHRSEEGQSELQQFPNSQESMIANLRKLSESFSGFQRCFNELQQHIGSIRTSIDSMLISAQTPINTTPLPASSPPLPSPEPEPETEPEYSLESDPSEDEEEEEVEAEAEAEEEVEVKSSPSRSELKSPKCYNSDNVPSTISQVGSQDNNSIPSMVPPGFGDNNNIASIVPQVGSVDNNNVPQGSRDNNNNIHTDLTRNRSELETICEMNDNRGLQRYMVDHISELIKLRQQIPKALKLSPSPARLVLNCIGKFYFQRRKSYLKGSQMKVLVRKAKVFLLECFLLMDNVKRVVVEIHKREAEQAALAWYKRMDSEGGIVTAQEIDARGLLLLVACFGIPQGFSNQVIKDLIRVSNVRMISDALRRSNIFMAKITEILEEMVKNKMIVKAVDIALHLGIENRFNPKKHLELFLRESKDSFDKMKNTTDAKRKYLYDLKSVIQCLGWHKIDPAKLLGGWQIEIKIKSLKRELAELKKQIGEKNVAQKRKINETEWLSNKEVKHSHFPNTWPQQQRVINHIDGNSTLLEGGTASHMNGYSMSPVVLNAAGHESVVGSQAGPVDGVAIGGPGAGISHASIGAVLQGGSYAGGHGGSRVDSTSGQMGSHAGHLYGLCGNAAIYDTLTSHRYAYRPAPYTEGSTGLPNTISDACRPQQYMESSKGLPNTIPGDAYRPLPFSEGSGGLPNTIPGDTYRPPPFSEGSGGLPNTIPGDAYRPPPLSEGSGGLPNTIPGDAYRPPPSLEGSTVNTVPSDVAGRISASETSQFADTVQATDVYRSSGSRAVDAAPSAVPAHPSSGLYWPRHHFLP